MVLYRLSLAVNSKQTPSTDQSKKKVLIVGGTGRVGSSTAASLSRQLPDLDLTLAGRSPANSVSFDSSHLPQGTSVLSLDYTDSRSLLQEVEKADLVVHTAGPFQQSKRCHVLEAALEAKTPYLDVCDDAPYTAMAKQFGNLAKERGVPAIIGGGVYPGLSNVMAAHIISTNKKEYDDDGFYQECPESDIQSVNSVKYFYFTAGSGGAGQTLLVTSLMLLGETVNAFQDGKRITMPPMSQPITVDFGPGIGRKGAFLLNLPEVLSAQEVFGAKNTSARFGTAPKFWNWLLWALARNVDPAILQDRSKMHQLASFSWPITKFVDQFVGEAVGMRVDVIFNNGKTASGIFHHGKLSQCLGVCVGAFARCMLDGDTQPGVWYPEEKQALKNRRKFLTFASKGCQRLILNRPSWQIESDPTRIGLGMYVY
eukprot:g4494.t1